MHIFDMYLGQILVYGVHVNKALATAVRAYRHVYSFLISTSRTLKQGEPGFQFVLLPVSGMFICTQQTFRIKYIVGKEPRGFQL
jgi:hypothetical protein